MTEVPESDICVENEKIFEWWDYPVFIFLTFIGLFAIAWFLEHWFSFGEWREYPIAFFVMTLLLLLLLVNNQFRWYLLLFMKRPRPMTAKRGWKVAVVTTFVPGAEPFEMLEHTLQALVALEYPHDTWVLDEGDDEQVKVLCRELGVNHFSRKNMPHYQTTEEGRFKTHCKHGNYNSWLYEIGFDRYEIFTLFDPDHIPNSDFLSHVLGYFNDSRIGYVQAAQVYYNQSASFIARGAAEETYAYYSSAQMAAYTMGYPIVTGCHNTHRITALKEIGGLAPHNAEDLLTTLVYRDRGWQGIYIPKTLARGITPVNWNGYMRQQHRWAHSVIDIKFRIYPKLLKNLTFKTRIISFLHGFCYIQDSVLMTLGLLLLLFMLTTGKTVVLSYLINMKFTGLLLILHGCDYYKQRYYLNWRSEWGLHWRSALLRCAKWPYVLLALLEVIMSRRIPYQLTLKIQQKSRRYVLVRPHLVIIILVAVAWILGNISRYNIHPSTYFFAIFTIVCSLGLILSEYMNFPVPYDKKLTEKIQVGSKMQEGSPIEIIVKSKTLFLQDDSSENKINNKKN